MNNKGTKVNNFDLLRIGAASQVMVSHGMWHLGVQGPWSLIKAFPGVPIFFIISGYLISASYERSPNLASYVRNRVLRIYPALWCCVLVTLAVALFFGFRPSTLKDMLWLPAQLVGLIFTPRFLASFGFGSYNGSLWTIPIELQFYAVLPVLYWLGRSKSDHFNRHLIIAWTLFTACGLAFTFISEPLAEPTSEPLLHKLIRYSFVPHFYLFLTGTLLQRYGANGKAWIAGKWPYWLALYLAFHFLMPDHPITAVAGNLLMSLWVTALAFSAPGLSEKLLRGNDISYGVYIYHGLVINILLQLGLGGRVSGFLLLIAATPLLAYISWTLVERPSLRRKRQTIQAALPEYTVSADAKQQSES